MARAWYWGNLSTHRQPMAVAMAIVVAALCAVPAASLLRGSSPTAAIPELHATGSSPVGGHPGLLSSSFRPASAVLGPYNGHFFRNVTYPPTGVITSSGYADVDTARHVVFASNSAGSDLVAFWESNGTLIGRVAAGNPLALETAGPVALDPVTHTVFVGVFATGRHGFILLFNATTLQPLGNLTLSGSPRPDFQPDLLTYDSASNQVFAINGSDGYVAAISGANDVVSSWIACPILGCFGAGVQALPGVHELAVSTGQNAVAVYNTTIDAFLTTLKVPGTTPVSTGALAYVPSTSTLVVANYSFGVASSFFYRFDLTSSSFIGSFPGVAPITVALAYDAADSAFVALNDSPVCPGGTVVCTGNYYTTVDLVDAATGTILDHYQTTGSAGATLSGLVIDPGTATAIVTGYDSAPTAALHLPTLSVLRQYAAYPTGSGPVVVYPAKGTYITAGYYPTQLQSVVESTGTVAWTASLPALDPTNFPSLAIDDQAGIVFIADGVGGVVQTVNGNTGSLGASIPLPITANATALAVDSTNHLLYVAESTGQVQVFGSVSGSLDGTIATPGLVVACAGVADPVRKVAYFANCGNPGNVTTVHSLSFNTGTVFAVGSVPLDLLLDPRGELIVVNFLSDNLTTIQLSNGLRGAIPLGVGNPLWLAEDLPDNLLAVADLTGSTVQMLNLTDGTPYPNAWAGNATGGLAFDNTSGTFVDVGLATSSAVLWSRLSVPSAPSAPSVLAGNNSLLVNWTAAIGGNGATLYNVTLTPSAGASVTVANLSSTQHQFTGLTDGILYSATVTAGNFVGTSAPAGPVSGTPVGIPYPPATVVATTIGSSAVVVWGPPASTDGSPVVNYTLEYSLGSLGTLASVSEGTSLSATVPALVPGSFYQFKVIAWNAVGASNASPIASAATSVPTVGVPGGFAGSTAGVGVGIAAVVAFAALAAVFMFRRRPPATPAPAP